MTGVCVMRNLLCILAMVIAVTGSEGATAQGLDVSGVPPGPGNAVRGLNGSVLDPSGLGNARTAPTVPSPNLSPVPVPTLASPTLDGRARRAAPIPYSRADLSRLRGRRARTVRREQAREIERGLPSICRGC